MTLLAVCGAHLEGQPLHPSLLALGARLVGAAATAPLYRMVALPGLPARPGLIRTRSGGGSVEVELYELPAAGLGELVAGLPPPLAVGTVRLADGREVTGFVCEGYAGDAPDITRFGGWRAYLAAAPA